MILVRISRFLLLAVVWVSLSPPASAIDKQAIHDQMMALVAQIQALRATPSPGSALAIEQAIADYRALSGQLGGYDPAGFGTADDTAGPGGGLGAGAPAPPVGCAPINTSSASADTPLPINDLAITTSNITVAGAGAYLFDVDVATNITHTWNADLNITLTSPAGTTVTLTTANGGSNDNVFAGTVWDDDGGGANPPGPVTDNLFANLVVETPLVVEEALGAFIGEDPNGVWTISVEDTALADTGTLSAWSLDIVSVAVAPTTVLAAFPSTDTPLPINDLATTTSTLAVAGAGSYILDVNLSTSITHTWSADINMTLTSPGGSAVTVSTANGGSNDNVFDGTLWDDDGGTANPPGAVSDNLFANLVVETPLVPEEAFGAFIGEDPNGNWSLAVEDTALADTGTLAAWSLEITTATCGCTLDLACPADVVADTAPGAPDVVVNYPAPTVSGTCTSVTTVCAPPSGDAFPIGTTPVNCSATDAATGETASCGFNVIVGGVSLLEIPTASSIGLAALALLLAGAGFLLLRRG